MYPVKKSFQQLERGSAKGVISLLEFHKDVWEIGDWSRRFYHLDERKLVKGGGLYVAVSYAWPEKHLDNESLCEEVEELMESFRKTDFYKIDGIKLVWLDVLCVPQGDGCFVREATYYMSEIYACAEKTILLVNGELRAKDLKEWHRRLWTLSEWTLSESCHPYNKEESRLEAAIGQNKNSSARHALRLAYQRKCKVSIDRIFVAASLVGMNMREIVNYDQDLNVALRKLQHFCDNVQLCALRHHSTEKEPVAPDTFCPKLLDTENLGLTLFVQTTRSYLERAPLLGDSLNSSDSTWKAKGLLISSLVLIYFVVAVLVGVVCASWTTSVMESFTCEGDNSLYAAVCNSPSNSTLRLYKATPKLKESRLINVSTSEGEVGGLTFRNTNMYSSSSTEFFLGPDLTISYGTDIGCVFRRNNTSFRENEIVNRFSCDRRGIVLVSTYLDKYLNLTYYTRQNHTTTGSISMLVDVDTLIGAVESSGARSFLPFNSNNSRTYIPIAGGASCSILIRGGSQTEFSKSCGMVMMFVIESLIYQNRSNDFISKPVELRTAGFDVMDTKGYIVKSIRYRNDSVGDWINYTYCDWEINWIAVAVLILELLVVGALTLFGFGDWLLLVIGTVVIGSVPIAYVEFRYVLAQRVRLPDVVFQGVFGSHGESYFVP
ncbi:hypothetical protein HK098_006513 [Nowakowskiella sp. JEL0407]|nr:hypothetical protein HK098_006513 [Nowakowskiella sp. JEL0407]